MSWKDIYGRQQVLRSVRSALSAGRLSHAYLFCGPEGIGKKTMAHALATALLCDTSMAEPCGTCSGCQKIKAGSHPDLHRIVSEGKSVKISQIKEMKKVAYLRPREGRYQVFILEQADAMTADAANSLLKLLEEPPPASLFILLAGSPAALLPTVVSRCQVYQLPRLGAADLALVLEAAGLPLSAEESRLAVGGAEGIPGRALTLARECRHGLYAEAVSLLSALREEGSLPALADTMAEHEEQAAFLEILLSVLRDGMVLQATGDQRLLLPAADTTALGQLLNWLTVSAARQALEIILTLQKELQSPVNARLAVEKSLRSLKEVFVNAESYRNSL